MKVFRSLALTNIVVIAGLLTGISSMGSQAHADWPEFMGPGRSGVVDGRGLNPEKLSKVKEVWSIDVDEGFGGAAISDGKVYLFDRQEQARDALRCVELATGKQLWEQSYKVAGKTSFNGSRSTPTVGDEYVFTCGPFSHVQAWDKKTGDKKWSVVLNDKYKGEVKNNWGAAHSPLIYGDLVVCAALGDEVGLVAFNQKTGKVAWVTEHVGFETYNSPRLYTMHGKEQILFMGRLTADDGGTGRLISIDPKTGKTNWKWDGYYVKFPIPSPLQVSDDTLFLSGGYGAGSVLVKVNKTPENYKFKELFRTKQGSQIHPVYHVDGHLYFNANTNDTMKGRNKAPGLMCMDLSGKLKWSMNSLKDYKTAKDINRGGMLLLDGLFYYLSGGKDGTLYVFKPSPDKFDLVKKAVVIENPGNSNVWAPMAATDGFLIVRNQAQMRCIDLR